MFWHVFFYNLKITIRDKQLVFWTLGFPIILATCFGFAFTNISQAADFKAIPMGVVETAEYAQDKNFQDMIMSHSEESEDPMFTVTFFKDEDSAAQSLKEKAIRGYIKIDDTIHLSVAGSSINESIMKQFLDYYVQMRSATDTIIAKNPMYGMRMQEILAKDTTYINEEESKTNAPDSALTYYYALIAMTCLYAAFHGMKQVSLAQANQSPQAARINLSPVNKLQVFFASLFSATFIQFVSILLLLLYMHFVQKVSFGDHIGYILLSSFIACLFGVSFGAFISAVIKGGEGIKTAVIISFSMAMSYFAGLMNASAKYQTTKSLPFMAYVNPAGLIADSFYSLYYYNTFDRFFQNISILLGISLVLIAGLTLIMRRQQYESL